MKTLALALPLLLFQTSSTVFAWGIRGHESICTAAAQLVQHAELAQYLNRKSAKVGTLCDVPDLQWRLMSQNYREHRLNPEDLGMTLKDLPLNYHSMLEQYPGQTKILGSNWWRAEQFYRRAVSLEKAMSDLQSTANPAREFLENLAFMGHFVADISQPLHSTADYDGYGTGHGGIHFFYEQSVVHNIPGDLNAKIVTRAKKKLQAEASNKLPFLTEKNVLMKVRALAIFSQSDKDNILNLDPRTKASSHERGMSIPAERSAAADAVKIYEPMIVDEMANAALLLAQIWDQAYEQVGSPKLSEAPAVNLPLVFSYVIPDYF